MKTGDSLQINLETESKEEAERLFKDLSNGGEIKMPLQETEWAERFGMFSDRFDVQWMVMYTGEKEL